MLAFHPGESVKVAEDSPIRAVQLRDRAVGMQATENRRQRRILRRVAIGYLKDVVAVVDVPGKAIRHLHQQVPGKAAVQADLQRLVIGIATVGAREARALQIVEAIL